MCPRISTRGCNRGVSCSAQPKASSSQRPRRLRRAPEDHRRARAANPRQTKARRTVCGGGIAHRLATTCTRRARTLEIAQARRGRLRAVPGGDRVHATTRLEYIYIHSSSTPRVDTFRPARRRQRRRCHTAHRHTQTRRYRHSVPPGILMRRFCKHACASTTPSSTSRASFRRRAHPHRLTPAGSLC